MWWPGTGDWSSRDAYLAGLTEMVQGHRGPAGFSGPGGRSDTYRGFRVERALTTAWFDEQSRLTPDELQTVTFPLSRLGLRGYEEEPVHKFLRTVHAEFVRLVNERASLWQEVQRLRLLIIAGEAGGDQHEVLFGQSDAHVHAVRILSTAQVTADRYVADAQAYSSRVTEEARLRRDEIMREAQQHSDMILEDAHARAREAAVSALNGAAPPQTDRERRAAQAELGAAHPAHLQRRLPGPSAGVYRGCPARYRGVGAQGSSNAQGVTTGAHRSPEHHGHR